VPSVILTILKTANAPEGVRLNFFEKWLVITRAAVFSMTLTSALTGVLLAFRDRHFAWLPALLVVIGLLLAHAANNVLNDYMDYRSGVDTPDYYRVHYSPHPIHSGMVSQRGLLLAFGLFSLIDFLLMLYFIALRGWGVAGFALAGFFISLFYVGGKFSLKFLGLGELAVLLVWGPLMVGGTYFVMAGRIPFDIYLASLPYALLVTTVLMGKHLDKAEKDTQKKIHTLPVLLGHQGTILFIKGLIVAFYFIILWESLAGVIPWMSLLSFLSLGRASDVWKLLSQPKPAEKPADWPIWPLWYVGWCFHLVKLAGGWFMGGMFAQILIQHFMH
jgi:1,4-dihydroxy-2-naphthoate octaprenyltransferase